ncbi:helix-turn-helix domain-containing protein [Roseibium alexandrii]|uniref:helix-turn-helix domain-containing protein n=1 Tax=Roseibium alexandrii TaxID=388408 RepID=UPI003752A07C
MAKRPRGAPTINPEPTDIPDTAPKQIALAEFANRLQTYMVKKGWNQSELARQASLQLPEGKTIGRDSISQYINAVSFPNPERLKALSVSLGVENSDLIPTKGVKSAASEIAPAMDMRQISDTEVFLRINKTLPRSVALKIMMLIDEAESA